MASQQLKRNSETEEEKKSSTLEGLPLESSPHVKYEDIEDYKLNAYGTQAHLPVRTGHGGWWHRRSNPFRQSLVRG
ncbi:hypothetical protein SLE2022_174780 [Rubroshorea leprosula]